MKQESSLQRLVFQTQTLKPLAFMKNIPGLNATI
jgi:hypothetical protein